MDLKYRNGIATLHINEVFPEDEGLYVCKATNSVGSVETKCNLKIKRKLIKNIFLSILTFSLYL